ncbi:MAG: hypothetical protein HY321_01330 [Armatimonadetes bacterium]|nr:hypothetical protein [Armatimonadota bacterium]
MAPLSARTCARPLCQCVLLAAAPSFLLPDADVELARSPNDETFTITGRIEPSSMARTRRGLIVGVYSLAAAAALGRRRKGAWGRAALAAPLFLMVLL